MFTKQILESEKKIRLVTQLKHSGIPLTAITRTEMNVTISLAAEPFDLNSTPQIDISESELNIIFYVAGYCSNQVKSRVKCPNCLSIVLSESNLPSVDQPN